MDSIGSVNVTRPRDGLVSSDSNINANSNTNTNDNANVNKNTAFKYRCKNAGNGIQCMDRNGTLSAKPNQRVEVKVLNENVFCAKKGI